jgi:hypothetical protein
MSGFSTTFTIGNTIPIPNNSKDVPIKTIKKIKTAFLLKCQCWSKSQILLYSLKFFKIKV